MNIESKTEQYKIRKLSDENIADAEQLHTKVYGNLPARGFFSMKYDTAFTGVSHIGFIAYNDLNRPIAFYAVIPCFIRFKHNVVLAAQSADTMTHPGYRKQGLFTKLALLTYELCLDTGIYLLFGFPNQNSLPGFVNKLGWQHTETMDCFIINAAVFSWARVVNKLSFLKRLYAVYQQKQLKKYLLQQTGISNSVTEEGFAGVYRDHHYLNYKIYTDTCVLKMDKSVIWIKITSVLLIGDILVVPDDFDKLMNALKKLANRLGIKSIHFHASPNTELNHLFSTRYSAIPSFPVIFKVLEADTPVDKIKFTSADIDTF